MKKVLLLGASAFALGIGSNAAFAEEPLKVTLSGTGQEWFGYATNNKNDVAARTALFSQSNNSFTLAGSSKLDNGITVAVSLSMNASPGTEGSQAHAAAGTATSKGFATSYSVPTGSPETNFVSFSGGFGSVSVGWQPNAALSTSMDAPSFGVGGLSWGRWAGWVVGGTGNTLAQGSGLTSVYDDFWANKVVYSTPSYMGAQITASFTPDMGSTDSGTVAKSTAIGNSTSVALTWGGDLGAAKVKAQAAWTGENFSGGANTPVAWVGAHLDGYQGGINVSSGGFTVGAAIADRSVKANTSNQVNAYTTKSGLSDGVTWDIGASYTTGPWGVAINYFTSQADSNTNTGTATGTSEDHYYGIDFQYTLGPGISVALENALISYKATPGGTTTAAAAKNDGWMSVLSTTVNF
jgi:predicted porin